MVWVKLSILSLLSNHGYSRPVGVTCSLREGAMKTYTPKTLDTSQIDLPDSLAELVEQLAENNHDHWASKRIDDGWTCGPKRNDERKEHPDLVPYQELPEAEKDYDRKTVLEALKAIIALGYELTKNR
jgi:hypothetical protein